MQWLRIRPHEGELDWPNLEDHDDEEEEQEENDEGDKAEQEGDDALEQGGTSEMQGVLGAGVGGEGKEVQEQEQTTSMKKDNLTTSTPNRVYRPLPAPRSTGASPSLPTAIASPSIISIPTPTSPSTFDFKNINLPDAGVLGSKVKGGLQAIRSRVRDSLDRDTAVVV